MGSHSPSLRSKPWAPFRGLAPGQGLIHRVAGQRNRFESRRQLAQGILTSWINAGLQSLDGLARSASLELQYDSAWKLLQHHRLSCSIAV